MVTPYANFPVFYHSVITGELRYDGPLYDGLLQMTDDMFGPSPMHIKYLSYVYDGLCIWRTNFPGPIESVISKFTCTIALDLPYLAIHWSCADDIVINGHYAVDRLGMTREAVTHISPLAPVEYIQHSLSIATHHFLPSLKSHSEKGACSTRNPEGEEGVSITKIVSLIT